MHDLTIGRLAKAAGVGVETIRFYERRGLIAQPKRPSGRAFRSYPNDVVAQVRFIRRAQETGFSLTEIAELLSLRTEPDGDCADVRARAVAKLADVERKIVELEHMRKALAAMIAACPTRGPRRCCTILDALETDSAVEPERPQRARASKKKGRQMQTATLKVEGMHCDGCAETLKALLTAEPGVKAATISFSSGEARVLFDPGATSLERLVAIAERPGFRVVGKPAS